MIREHPRESSTLLECTNCERTWLVRNVTEKRLKESTKRHFTDCHAPEPEPLPKNVRIYNLPR
jgi:hypothetical protein